MFRRLGARKHVIEGKPDKSKLSTSCVERIDGYGHRADRSRIEMKQNAAD